MPGVVVCSIHEEVAERFGQVPESSDHEDASGDTHTRAGAAARASSSLQRFVRFDEATHYSIKSHAQPIAALLVAWMGDAQLAGDNGASERPLG